MVEAIMKEIELRKDYLKDKNLTSIYFGGGTPSLLDRSDLEKIFSSLSNIYSWNKDTEITLEANPDDLTSSNLNEFKQAGINRLSIGIQSFDQDDLTFMNRAHNAKEAEYSIKKAQDIGFDNISGDLIYGSPTTSNKTWESNIEKILAFDIPHISAYCLTVEEGTALHHFVSSGRSKSVDDMKSAHQFETLIDRLQQAGFDHYEISNFGKPHHYAVHNTNYWMGVPYLGLGPAAHSFDGESTRSWNLAHNPNYIKQIVANKLPTEHETLSEKERFNEFILIRLRTKWGIDQATLTKEYSKYEDHFLAQIDQFIIQGSVIFEEGVYKLTGKGKNLADRISMELFID